MCTVNGMQKRPRTKSRNGRYETCAMNSMTRATTCVHGAWGDSPCTASKHKNITNTSGLHNNQDTMHARREKYAPCVQCTRNERCNSPTLSAFTSVFNHDLTIIRHKLQQKPHLSRFTAAFAQCTRLEEMFFLFTRVALHWSTMEIRGRDTVTLLLTKHSRKYPRHNLRREAHTLDVYVAHVSIAKR